jgi:hypothetical protein
MRIHAQKKMIVQYSTKNPFVWARVWFRNLRIELKNIVHINSNLDEEGDAREQAV